MASQTACLALSAPWQTASMLPPCRLGKSRLDSLFDGPNMGLQAWPQRFSGPLCAAQVQVTYEEALTYFMGLGLSHLRRGLPKRQKRSMLSMCCGQPQVGWRVCCRIHQQAAV